MYKLHTKQFNSSIPYANNILANVKLNLDSVFSVSLLRRRFYIEKFLLQF